MNQLASSTSTNGIPSSVTGQPLSTGRGKKNKSDWLYSLPNSAPGHGPVGVGGGRGGGTIMKLVTISKSASTSSSPLHMQNGIDHHRHQTLHRHQGLNNRGIKRKNLLQKARLVVDDDDDDDNIDDDDDDNIDDGGGGNNDVHNDEDEDDHDIDDNNDDDDDNSDDKINPKHALKTFSSFNDPHHRFHGHADRGKCNHGVNDAKRPKYR